MSISYCFQNFHDSNELSPHQILMLNKYLLRYHFVLISRSICFYFLELNFMFFDSERKTKLIKEKKSEKVVHSICELFPNAPMCGLWAIVAYFYLKNYWFSSPFETLFFVFRFAFTDSVLQHNIWSVQLHPIPVPVYILHEIHAKAKIQ